MNKKVISFIFGILFSLAFIFILVKNLDFQNLMFHYSKMNFLWLIPYTLILTLQLVLRGYKWGLILLPLKKIKVYDTFRIETAGLSINNILPFRLGEVARAFITKKMFSVSFISVFSTIILERLVDFIAMGLIFISFYSFANISNFIASKHLFYVGIAIFIVFISLIYSDKILELNFIKKNIKKNVKFENFINRISISLKSFQKPYFAFYIVFVGVVQWLMEALNNYILAYAFNLENFVSFPRAVLILCSTALGVSLPSMPGYFGNFEFAATKILTFWGAGKEHAFAYATVLHISGYLIMTVLGIFFIYSMGHNLTEIFKINKNEEK